MDTKIEANEMSISECLSKEGDYYKIPDYQRRYSWGKEQLEDFWYDLNSLEENDEHFLGSIVVITDAYRMDFNKLELVDGQQRLTTILLLLKTIYDYFNEKHKEEESKLADRIEDKYLYSENFKGERRLNLELGKLDREDFNNIIDDNRKNIENDKLLYSFKYFKEKIFELDYNEVEIIYRKLLQQMLIVVITAGNEKSAFRLFETLNDRGLELSAIDLMKNYLLKTITNQDQKTQLIKDKWENIILNIQNIDRKVRFFRHYIMASEPETNQKVTQKRVYDRFKEIIDEDLREINLSIEEYIDDMEEKSELYKSICDADISHGIFTRDEKSKINQHLRNITSIGAAPSRTLLIKSFEELFKNKIAPENLIEILKMVEIFSIRRIIGQLSTGELDTIYNTLAVNAFKTNDPVNHIRNVFLENIPSDDEFEKNFRERNFRNNNQTKYILDTLERKYYMSSGQGKSIKDRSAVHIEHIAPTGAFTTEKYKEWSDYLKMSQEEFNNIKTKIGNLTLFESKLNIAASDKPFKQKKEHYKNSDFIMTTSLFDYEEWSKENILERTQKLSRIAKNIWTI